MAKINANEPAFPRPAQSFPNGGFEYGANGMSLRDYFAAHALSGILASPHKITDLGGELKGDGGTLGIQARLAYAQADAMLEARKNHE